MAVEYSSNGKKKIKDGNNASKKLDKFYTSPSAVDTVVDFIDSLFERNGYDISGYSFLEPCAGGGAFLDGIERRHPDSKCISFDIAPEDPRIEKADFLSMKPENDPKMIAIGNPPFGYKGDLAVSFINRCSEWCPIVVFVLPIQFRRYNIQKRVNGNLKLIYSSDDLPTDSFILEGKPYDVNCLFQIWVDVFSDLFRSCPNLRLLKPLPNRHPDFITYIHNNTIQTLKYFDKEIYQWDFAVARQGFYDYNHKITDPSELQRNVQYLFVKYKEPCSKTVFDNIDFEKLSHVNTAVLGFSNTDLVAEYVRVKKELGL